MAFAVLDYEEQEAFASSMSHGGGKRRDVMLIGWARRNCRDCPTYHFVRHGPDEQETVAHPSRC